MGGAEGGAAALPLLSQELEEGAREEEERQREKAKQIFISQDLSQYVVKGSEREWEAALLGGKKTVATLSIKTGEKRPVGDMEDQQAEAAGKRKKENQGPDSLGHKKKKKNKNKQRDER